MKCYKCKAEGETEVSGAPSKLAWIMSFILFALGCVCIFWVPVSPCAKKWGFWDYEHVCPNCRALISVKRHDLRSRYKSVPNKDPEKPEERKWEQIKGIIKFDRHGRVQKVIPRTSGNLQEEVLSDDD